MQLNKLPHTAPLLILLLSRGGWIGVCFLPLLSLSLDEFLVSLFLLVETNRELNAAAATALCVCVYVVVVSFNLVKLACVTQVKAALSVSRITRLLPLVCLSGENQQTLQRRDAGEAHRRRRRRRERK